MKNLEILNALDCAKMELKSIDLDSLGYDNKNALTDIIGKLDELRNDYLYPAQLRGTRHVIKTYEGNTYRLRKYIDGIGWYYVSNKVDGKMFDTKTELYFNSDMSRAAFFSGGEYVNSKLAIDHDLEAILI